MNDITEVDRLNAEIADLKRTIEWYQGRTGIMMGVAARGEIVGAPASGPQDDALHFNAQRLRNVVKLVGLESAVPQDDATLDGARGAVLGQIAAKLRRQSAVPQGYVLALQTVVELPDGKKELGYTLLSGIGIFTTAEEVHDAIAELSLPLGWVSMTTSQLLPGWMAPAATPTKT